MLNLARSLCKFMLLNVNKYYILKLIFVHPFSGRTYLMVEV